MKKRAFISLKFAGILGFCAVMAALCPHRAAAQDQPTQDDITVSPTTSGSSDYMIINATTSGGPDAGSSWWEIQVPASGYKLNFVNFSGGPITLSDVSFQLSPTYIPLDDLNFNDSYLGSQSSFTPLPGADTTISSDSTNSVSLPDACSTLTLLGLAFGAQAAIRRRLAKA